MSSYLTASEGEVSQGTCLSGLLPPKQGNESPLALLGSGLHLHLMPALLLLWQFDEPIQLTQPMENGLVFSCFIFYSLWNELAHTGVTEHSQHAVMNQDHAWVGVHPGGKEGEEVLGEQ